MKNPEIAIKTTDVANNNSNSCSCAALYLVGTEPNYAKMAQWSS